MSEPVLLDNDIAFKVACYRLVDEMIAATTINDTPPAMLSVGRFVLRKKLARHQRVRDSPAAQNALEQLLQSVGFVEPIEGEIALASGIEAAAARSGLELDSGESLLLAMLHLREHAYLVTGDKRAVVAMAVVARELSAGRVRCLEQLMAQIIDHLGVPAVRAHVCSEPLADRALSAAFSCASAGEQSTEGVLAGLSSYIEHLRREAPGILHEGPF